MYVISNRCMYLFYQASSSSVFKRLGPNAVKRPATSTSMLDSDSESDDEDAPALEYAGVLKDTGAPKPKMKKLTQTATITNPAAKAATKPNLRMSIEQRLGDPVQKPAPKMNLKKTIEQQIGECTVRSETTACR